MPKSPLLDYLAGEQDFRDRDDEAVSLLVAEARASGVLHRLLHRWSSDTSGHQTAATGIADLANASAIYRNSFVRDVRRELRLLQDALSKLDTPVILLKGASYIAQDLPPAAGRIFSDIDILVTKEMIGPAEAALMLGGWSTGKLDAYDARYYRTWSHEIPPMTHLQRGTTVDLHHSLVMPTCRTKVDSQKMIAAAVPIDGQAGFWWRLKDEDMVLHAAGHLLLNAEFDRGLRDLWDIDLLYRHFAKRTPQFHDRLLERASEVGLEPTAIMALQLAAGIFRTPLSRPLPAAPRGVVAALMARAVSTRHPATRPTGQSFADFVLALREMYLRLPNRLLAIHLSHKIAGFFAGEASPSTQTGR